MHKYILHLDGLHCPSCGSYVADKIRRQLKTSKITSSYRKGEVVVFSSFEYEEGDFRKALEGSGYVMVGLEKTQAKKFLCFWR